MNLNEWFEAFARNLGRQLKDQLKVGHVVSRKIAPSWSFKYLDLMEIEYIGLRSGEEADFIVFLDRDMCKFHEVYLVE